jgi:hypothetical protein
MLSPLHLPKLNVCLFLLTHGIVMQTLVEEETKEMHSQKNSPLAIAHTEYVHLSSSLGSSMVKNQK